MKIAILSDFHFGFGHSSELENDTFDNVEEAMEKSLDSDLIILGGDIFDSRVPKTQTWSQTMKILTKPLLKENPGIKLIDSSKKLKEISQRTLRHIPLIALHGNHERRGKGEHNTVEALENAGILIHLHLNTMVFEKDGVRVAIHGMSNVPERFAKDVLYQWNPKPLPNCFNILLLHQSIDPYVYSPLEPPTLNISNLPKGFDLIIDGHVHAHAIDKVNGTTLAIVGSTIVTQFGKEESEREKGFIKLEVGNESKINFIPLEKNRRFLYEEIVIDKSQSVREQLEKRLNDLIYSRNFQKTPLIKLRVKGKETDILEQDLRSIEKKYLGKAIVNFVKELESPEITEKMEFLRNLREQKFSVEEIGLSLLRKNLEELQFTNLFDYDTVYKLLSDNEVEKVFNLLTGEQTTLWQVK